jgi:uncharacterized membrane protein YeaQ/YmgE (transglycosylase-associated protein family)
MPTSRASSSKTAPEPPDRAKRHFAWVILGAAAGWIASLINKTNNQQGWIGNIVLGIVGGVVGGFLWGLITDSNGIDFSIGGLIIAVVGALIVSFLFSMLTGKRGV